jgi:hypothetical protein
LNDCNEKRTINKLNCYIFLLQKTKQKALAAKNLSNLTKREALDGMTSFKTKISTSLLISIARHNRQPSVFCPG